MRDQSPPATGAQQSNNPTIRAWSERLGAGWVDSHCHMADPRIEDPSSVLDQARGAGVTGFVMAGVDPDDWDRQLALASQHPECVPVLGLHPYYVADHSLEECESALDLLARRLKAAPGLIGEMGLDLRTHIAKDSGARQIEIFHAQLELARFAARPVVLHIVRAFREVQRLFEHFGPPARGGFVHAFGGSRPEVEYYLSQGLHLSLGGSVLKPDNQRLNQAIEILPLDRLLLESDSPDQAPPGYPPEQNRPTSILAVAARIADLKGVTRDEVLATSRRNLIALLET